MLSIINIYHVSDICQLGWSHIFSRLAPIAVNCQRQTEHKHYHRWPADQLTPPPLCHCTEERASTNSAVEIYDSPAVHFIGFKVFVLCPAAFKGHSLCSGVGSVLVTQYNNSPSDDTVLVKAMRTRLVGSANMGRCLSYVDQMIWVKEMCKPYPLSECASKKPK